MGIAIVLACLMLLFRDRWFLAQTEKGKSLVGWLGETQALWVLRAILLGFAAVGALLATGFIRPIKWDWAVSDSSDAAGPLARQRQRPHRRPGWPSTMPIELAGHPLHSIPVQ